MSEFVLRPARPSDARVVAAYHHRCWVEAFSGLLGPAVVAGLDPWRRLPTFEHWFSPDQHEVTTVVAEAAGGGASDGTVVGHATVGGNEVIHLFIDPSHWGEGLGSLLLARAESLLSSSGVSVAELTTIVGNAPALSLYEGAGWTVTDRTVESEQDGINYTEVVLVKELAPQGA